MPAPDTLIDALKEWMQVGNPGLVTKDDLTALEARLDELAELVDELEKKLDTRTTGSAKDTFGADE